MFDEYRRFRDRGLTAQNRNRRHASRQRYHRFRKIYQPVNDEQTHWILLVADTENKEILVYDSMATVSRRQYGLIFEELLRECENLDVDWTIRELGTSTPQQEDGCQCGAFVCITMLWLLGGKQLDFTHAYIQSEGRRHICQSIKNNKIMDIST